MRLKHLIATVAVAATLSLSAAFAPGHDASATTAGYWDSKRADIPNLPTAGYWDTDRYTPKPETAGYWDTDRYTPTWCSGSKCTATKGGW